jgi:drug/metabolite transporter (DMT)-like permease
VHPLFATSVTYLIPIIAIFWGLMDGEKLIPLQFLFIIAILIGVYLVTWKNNKKQHQTYEKK